jgi:hypothetical protein
MDMTEELKFIMLRHRLMLVIGVFLACSAVTSAQETFDGNNYTLDLPNSTWRITSRSDTVHQHSEFVYGDRLDGYLRLRREAVDGDMTPAKMAERDEDTKLRYISGFVRGKTAPFTGRLPGIVLSYEYTAAGKAMSGRVYYLQADPRTIYVLSFSGLREKLQKIQNQTDSIARSFRAK